MFAAAKHINGIVLPANAHLLLWLSLFPAMMAWLESIQTLLLRLTVWSWISHHWRIGSFLGADIHPWIADVLFVLAALIWLIPDQRIERTLVGYHEAECIKKISGTVPLLPKRRKANRMPAASANCVGAVSVVSVSMGDLLTPEF